MGNYANFDDVADRYPTVAKVADSEEMQESFISGVEGWMDAYLTKQFTTPVSDRPPLLTDICVDLTYCKINFNRDKGIPKLKEDTLKILMDISTGMIQLTDSAGAEITMRGHAIFGSMTQYEPSFSMLGTPDDLVDPDLLTDLISDRS